MTVHLQELFIALEIWFCVIKMNLSVFIYIYIFHIVIVYTYSWWWSLILCALWKKIFCSGNELFVSNIAGKSFKWTWGETFALYQSEIGWRGLWLRVLCENDRSLSSLEVSFVWCSHHWSETCGHPHPEQEASSQDGSSFTPYTYVHQAREQAFRWVIGNAQSVNVFQ